MRAFHREPAVGVSPGLPPDEATAAVGRALPCLQWSHPSTTHKEYPMPVIAWLLGVPLSVVLLLMLLGVF